MGLEFSVMAESPVSDVAGNPELAYEYSRWFYERLSASAQSLNTRLGALIGLSSVVLRFSAEMPVGGEFLLWLRRAVVVLGLVALVAGLRGLSVRLSGAVLSPTALLEKWYYVPEERCRMAVVTCWESGAKSLGEDCLRKVFWLRLEIVCLALAAVCFGAAALV